MKLDSFYFKQNKHTRGKTHTTSKGRAEAGYATTVNWRSRQLKCVGELPVTSTEFKICAVQFLSS